ncbi:hypothetical protein TREES_T100011597 [Tupaia chinensis]|uniref:Uncharacterized protein n=1 Tax=Tupaia chinensis TaxID=246437 RepID=L9L803_TUPCH|nr:hypothetical protein TREES_T100011597 [Tupaia chinensis]
MNQHLVLDQYLNGLRFERPMEDQFSSKEVASLGSQGSWLQQGGQYESSAHGVNGSPFQALPPVGEPPWCVLKFCISMRSAKDTLSL